MNRLSDYDFELPPDRIATEPAERRDAARLLVVDRRTGALRHHTVADLPDLLHPGDRLVLNDSRVIPARLVGHRQQTGGKWEGLFLSADESGIWRMLSQTRGRLRPGERIMVTPADDPEPTSLSGELALELERREEDGIFCFRPQRNEPFLELLNRFGEVPLPPYIARAHADARDRERYQTVYSAMPGSVAAPTAGLHFTPELLERCRAAGIDVARVTLHVGIGTFRPISVEEIDAHRMHSEWCEIREETAGAILETRQRGGRIIGVGTTAVRTLESASRAGRLQAFRGTTDLFIREPYAFQTVGGMLTNFHLPKSTLLILVCAFAGRELTFRAYRQAIADGYRFYSYGDAMLIL